jgi:hypothetical protein
MDTHRSDTTMLLFIRINSPNNPVIFDSSFYPLCRRSLLLYLNQAYTVPGVIDVYTEKKMNTTVHITLPEQLLRQAESLVKEGWNADLNTLMAEALRRYIESHQAQLAETFLREDVRWGLHGSE